MTSTAGPFLRYDNWNIVDEDELYLGSPPQGSATRWIGGFKW